MQVLVVANLAQTGVGDAVFPGTVGLLDLGGVRELLTAVEQQLAHGLGDARDFHPLAGVAVFLLQPLGLGAELGQFGGDGPLGAGGIAELFGQLRVHRREFHHQDMTPRGLDRGGLGLSLGLLGLGEAPRAHGLPQETDAGLGALKFQLVLVAFRPQEILAHTLGQDFPVQARQLGAQGALARLLGQETGLLGGRGLAFRGRLRHLRREILQGLAGVLGALPRGGQGLGPVREALVQLAEAGGEGGLVGARLGELLLEFRDRDIFLGGLGLLLGLGPQDLDLLAQALDLGRRILQGLGQGRRFGLLVAHHLHVAQGLAVEFGQALGDVGVAGALQFLDTGLDQADGDRGILLGGQDVGDDLALVLLPRGVGLGFALGRAEGMAGAQAEPGQEEDQ